MARALALMVLISSSAAVAAGEAADVPVVEPRGIFVGEQWRYQNRHGFAGLGLRLAADLISIPATMVNWNAQDAAIAALTVVSTVTLSIPLHPSLDVRLQVEVQKSLGDNHPVVWTTYTDAVIWITLFSGVATSLFYGIASGKEEYVETASLAFEAWLIAQIFANVIKVFLGREGPMDGNGQGDFFGPKAYLRLFPAGSPSGHMTSLYAMLAVVMYYWNDPALWIVLNTVAILAGVTMVMDNYHFASDIILGAAIGFFTGRWVVHHRSSRYRYARDGYVERITFAPAILPGAGYGFALGFSF